MTLETLVNAADIVDFIDNEYERILKEFFQKYSFASKSEHSISFELIEGYSFKHLEKLVRVTHKYHRVRKFRALGVHRQGNFVVVQLLQIFPMRF